MDFSVYTGGYSCLQCSLVTLSKQGKLTIETNFSWEVFLRPQPNISVKQCSSPIGIPFSFLLFNSINNNKKTLYFVTWPCWYCFFFCFSLYQPNRIGYFTDISPNNLDRYSQTPLLWATQNEYKKVVKILLWQDDFNSNTHDNYGQTPLLWAAQNAHKEVVKILVSQVTSALTNQIMMVKCRICGLSGMRTRERGKRELWKYYSNKTGFNPNKLDNEGKTPLLWATWNGSKWETDEGV